MINAKRKGEPISSPEPEADEEPADLLAALKASVEAAKRTKGSTRAKRPAAPKPAGRRRKPSKSR